MIILNLISPDQRRLLRQRWAMDELRSLTVSVLFVAALASAAGFSARYLLASARDLFTSNVQATAAAAKVNENSVAAAQLVRSYLAEDVDWPSFLARFGRTVPNHVTINSLEVDSSGSVQVTGEAATRADLLLFQKQLEESGIITRLYSPVRNLLQPAQINFELSAQLASSTAGATARPE